MEEVFQALAHLGTPLYWGAVIVAVLAAAITGIMPGASSILVMSLAIPFIVFKIEDPAIGLVMLATITGVNNTLDSIPAILIGQPGAATQVTFLEGHQLARRGKAAHTLGAVYAVSAMGGVIGAVTLAMLIPVIKPLILKFGFPEIAAMALFGVAMVSALSRGAMVKGLAAGMLGILFGTVGLNPVTGDWRFIFQRLELVTGLPLIATTLGLFALPEMIDLTMARRPVAPPQTKISSRDVLDGVWVGLSKWRMVIRQSVFGVLLGAIPGVGSAVIDWLSYAFGIFWTKDKSQFGKGSLDGVLFAESAQNSKEAGQAIPTLALGVPGGLAWALVLVAMLAYNIAPGPPLLGDRADITILLVITLAIGNLFVTMLGIAATGTLAKLTLIPYPLIGAVVIPISLLTGYVNMTSWLSLPIMLSFTAIGITMKHYQWPRPPLLLGIILGRIIEFNLLSALSIHGGLGIATRPITIGLVLIAVGTAYAFARSSKAQDRLVGPAATGAAVTEPPPVAGGSMDADPAVAKVSLLRATLEWRNFPVVLAIAGATGLFIYSFDYRTLGALLPRAMAIGIVLLSLIELVKNIRSRTHERVDIMDLGMHSLALPGAVRAGAIIAGMIAMLLLLSGIIGYRWGVLSYAFLCPLLLLPNEWGWVGSLVRRYGGGARAGLWTTRIIGAVFATALVFLFEWMMMDRLLAVIWPQAALLSWIGQHSFGMSIFAGIVALAAAGGLVAWLPRRRSTARR